MLRKAGWLETILYRRSLLILNHRACPHITVSSFMPMVHSTTSHIWPTILLWNSTMTLRMSLNSVGICLMAIEEFISIVKILFKYGDSVVQKWSIMVMEGGCAITVPRHVMVVRSGLDTVSNVFLAINPIQEVECPVVSKLQSFRQILRLHPIQPFPTRLHPPLPIPTQLKIKAVKIRRKTFKIRSKIFKILPILILAHQQSTLTQTILSNMRLSTCTRWQWPKWPSMDSALSAQSFSSFSSLSKWPLSPGSFSTSWISGTSVASISSSTPTSPTT